MARQPDIQYVSFYTAGSAAMKIQPAVPAKAVAPKAKPRKQKRIVLHVDPVALCGIAVAALMLVLMVVGMGQLQAARQETVAMQQYVATLREENAELHSDYEASYDLDEVREMALALGMVPGEQAPNTYISVTENQEVVQLSFWDQVTVFFTTLFSAK